MHRRRLTSFSFVFFTGFQGEDFLQLIQVLQNKFKLKDRAFQMNNNNNKYDQYLQLPWSPMSCADYKNMYFVRSCFGTNEPLTSLTLCPHFFFQISADIQQKVPLEEIKSRRRLKVPTNAIYNSNTLDRKFIIYYQQKFNVNTKRNFRMNYLFLSLTHFLFISAYD